tara:strand:- start:8277 stop:8888 length:612 start_codon:yes stop_codon:yes gene_type:complete
MCHPAVFTAMGTSTATAATAAIYTNIGLGAMSIMQAKSAQKTQIALANQAYQDKVEQIKDNRVSVKLEAIQKSNSLAQEFLRRQATNRALLSPSGIGQSNSFEAAMRYNKSQYHQELNAIAINESRRQADLAYASQEARIQLQSTKVAAKSAFQQALLKSAVTTSTAISGIKQPPNATSTLTNERRIMGGFNGEYSPLGGAKS